MLTRNADHPFATASSIKLPLVLELYRMEQDARAGKPAKARLGDLYTVDPKDLVPDSMIHGGMTPGVTRVTNRDLAQFVVAVSDNSACNILIDRVGMENVNDLLRSLGLQQMKLQRKMMDLKAATEGRENLSSPHDFVLLLKAIYDGKVLDPEMTKAFLEQFATYKNSPPHRYLPEDTRIVDKPGELAAVRTDSGIIYAQNRPFAFSIMTGYARNERDAEAAIGEITLAAYNYFDRVGRSSQYGRIITSANSAEPNK
jgi:beta-lactamase class A